MRNRVLFHRQRVNTESMSESGVIYRQCWFITSCKEQTYVWTDVLPYLCVHASVSLVFIFLAALHLRILPKYHYHKHISSHQPIHHCPHVHWVAIWVLYSRPCRAYKRDKIYSTGTRRLYRLFPQLDHIFNTARPVQSKSGFCYLPNPSVRHVNNRTTLATIFSHHCWLE